MQWMAGHVKATTGIKGVGDFVGKMVKGAITKETAVKPEYVGNGILVLEPTYKYLILVDVGSWGEKGMTIEDVLKSAFSYLFDMEQNINEIYESMADATDDEIAEMMEEVGTLQDMLTNHDFYMIDAKVEQVARALGLLELGLDHDVTDLSGGQRTKVLLAKLLLEKPEILLLDEPTNYLDAEHIEWLKRYLQEYENAFILISHDIPFLNDVVNIIYLSLIHI